MKTKKSVKIRVNPWLKISQSKITKLCKTKPIFETPKMNLTNYMTKAYDNNSPLLKVQKRSQNEPNQTQFYSYPVWRACPLEFIRLRRDARTGLQAIRHQRCDVLQLAKAIRPGEAQPGKASQKPAERECSAQKACGGFVAG